jgi:glycosyltransferase 2 family protein
VKKLLILILKIGLPLAIIIWLWRDALHKSASADLLESQKNWGILLLACLFCAAAPMITFVRWCMLVNALDIPLRFRDAFRIGFVSYLFNLAPMGVVGGDILKAWLLSKERPDLPGCRTKAFASVFFDRMIGLYTLFLLATAAILATNFWNYPSIQVRIASQITLGITLVGTIAFFSGLMPGGTEGPLGRKLRSLPKLGSSFGHALDSLAMYRSKPGLIFIACLMSFGVHTCFVLGMYAIAKGIYPQTLPSELGLSAQFVVCPVSAATTVIPLCMGPFETVLSFLYAAVAGVQSAQAQGLVVALAYRIVTVLIASVGLVFYFASRSEVSEVLHEAEIDPEDVENPPSINRARFSEAG